ncbi:MAG: pilus assembly protein PilM [Planctomycetes bacterium]|nr:pilus assembly protein PilM [Planctomycetota bacterium]
MAKKAIAVDLGSHSAKLLLAEVGKQGVRVLRFAGVPRSDGGGRAPLGAAGLPLRGAVCGLTGRDMTLRYSQVPPTPDWQLRNLMDLEIQDLAQQSGGALSADYNLLPAQDANSGVDTVLLALAKDEALERLQGELAEAGGSAVAFVPNCTALYNAFLKCGPVDPDSVVCLANIGHETIDVALVKGTDLLFARNLSGGTKVVDEAIASAFNVAPRKAESLKKDLLDLDPQSRGRYASSQAEKVTLAAGPAAGAIAAAIQSSLSFCKAQTKIADLRLDRVLLAGGGARLRGLRGMLRESLRCPVELFDPFANADLSALPPEDQEQLVAMRHEAVVALGLAVGRLDDSLYSLEILPESVKRRLRFQQRTVWNVVAGLLAAAMLVLLAIDARREAEATESGVAALRRKLNATQAVHQAAAQEIEENKKQRALVDHLAGQAMPGTVLLRTLRAVAERLPSQLWATRVEVLPAQTTGTGSNQKRRTTLVFEGAGKEIDGVDANAVYDTFVKQVRADLEKAGLGLAMVPSGSTDGSIRFKITVTEGG